MTTAHIDNGALVIRFTAREKIAGLLRDMDVSLGAVRSASVEPDGLAAAKGVRAPGLALPGLRKIGTWRRGPGSRVVVVRRGRPALRVELTGHRYAGLLLDLDDAGDLARTLTGNSRNTSSTADAPVGPIPQEQTP